MQCLSRSFGFTMRSRIERHASSAEAHVLRVEGPLHAPASADLRRCVQALLQSGERHIVVSLNRVFDVDAGGLGELVRAYNMTTAASGVFRIEGANHRVRTILERVGLYDVLASAPARSLQQRA